MNQTEPLISVVIPCYNSEVYIGECLDSILHQSYTNLEVIVVDNGSKDNTVAKVKEITDPRIKLVHEKIKGPAAARNRGLKEAQGDYIAFNDSDDVWLEGKLKKQYACLNNNPEMLFCFGSFLFWKRDKNGTFSVPEIEGNCEALDYDPALSGDIVNQLIFDAKVWTPTVLMRRELIDKIGYFKTDLIMGEDHEYWFRASMLSKTAKLAYPLALYRKNEQSITHKLHERNYAAEVFEIFVSTLKQAGRLECSAEDVRSHRYKLWFQFGYKSLHGGNKRLARKGFFNSIRHKPFALSAWFNLVKSYL